MSDVTFERDDYAAEVPKWALISDAAEGQMAVKSKGDTYLPRPNPLDVSADNVIRYKQYIARAVYYNATARTLSSLVGAAFRKNPELITPDAIDYVSEDVDGAGVSIYQQSQSTLRQVLKLGRHALLVDYPIVSTPASRADMESGRLRATITPLLATQIINWRTAQIGSKHLLILAVIAETREVPTEDGFGAEVEPQYRVLRLTDAGYTYEIWRKGAQNWAIAEGPFVVLDGAGRAWDEIPLAFVGANNNDASIDPAPLYDLAELNIAHYRNSADYEDSVWYCGQPQVSISGLSEEWRDWLQAQGIYVGSRAPMLLPVGGAFAIAQAAPNTLAKEAMDQKEAQMVALGARLLQPGTVAKTATESQGEQEAEHSVLSLACANTSEAYTKSLGWMARFMAADGDAKYVINQDFVEQKLDPQMLTALIQAWQSGTLPEGDLWAQLRKFGLIDAEKTDEQIREEIDSQDPGLGLPDDTGGAGGAAAATR